MAQAEAASAGESSTGSTIQSMQELMAIQERLNPIQSPGFVDAFENYEFEKVYSSTLLHPMTTHYHFCVPPSPANQTDTLETVFTIKLQLKKNDGTAFGAAAAAAAAENFYMREGLFHNLWKDIKLQIGNHDLKLITGEEYARTTYIQMLMKAKKEDLKWLKLSTGWAPLPLNLEPNHQVAIVDGNGANEIRHAAETPYATHYTNAYLEDREITLTGRLFIPLFETQRFLPPGVSINITLVRNDAKAILQRRDNNNLPQIHIKDMYFNVKRVLLSAPSQQLQNSLVLKNGGMNFPVSWGDLIKHRMVAGSSVYTFHQAIHDELPRRILLCFARTESTESGDCRYHPYYFELLKGLRSIKVEYNNKVYPPRDGFNFQWSQVDDANPSWDKMKRDNLHLYQSNMSVYHKMDTLGQVALDIDTWLKRHFVVAIDMSMGGSSRNMEKSSTALRAGSVGITVELGRGLPENMTMLMLIERHAMVSVQVPTMAVSVDPL